MKTILTILQGVLLLVCSLFPLAVSAQQPISIPYMHSFEKTGGEAAENNEWHMDNPIPVTPNDKHDAWYIDGATFSEGLSSLYISCDSGRTANYGQNQSVVVAYRKMTIPSGAYIFTFDWINNASVNSGLYVCLVPDMGTPPTSDFASSKIPQWVKDSRYSITTSKGTTECLKGALEWENAMFQENFSRQTSVYFTFVWVNDELDSVPNPLAACIDNIQITSANCRYPSGIDIKAGCDTVVVSWNGTAEKYQLQYRENGTSKWRTVDDIRQTSYMITGLNEGVYDFRVRSVCNDTMYSAYTTRNAQIVFCPDNHCINFTDLSSADVKCYIGTAGEDDFYLSGGPIDDGANSQTSRHTVYWTRNQYDPRTDYKLRTIPDGELASVRLGNWQNGGQAERIVYRYTVDATEAPVMLLKYAIVFELPDHEKHEQPYFDLTIFDEKGNVIGGSLLCGKAEFYAGYGDVDAWRNVKIGDRTISWKNWTTLGVNLAGYEGQTVSIQLTTQDCVPQAHYAYAYFTLGCIDGTIKSVSCGADPFMDIEAPDGFDYHWFTQYDAYGNPADDKGHGRVQSVPSSDKVPYYCRCTFKEKSGCYFDLSTVVSPREPFAEFGWKQEAHDCENWVRFSNRSHVTTVVNDQLVHTPEKAQTAYWDFGNGVTSDENDPVLRVNDGGDTLKVRMVAGISGDLCQDDTVITVVVRSIFSPVDERDSIVCQDNGAILWGNQYISESGIYYDSLKNYAGCDSVRILNVTMYPRVEDVVLYDTVCFGDTLKYNDNAYTVSGEYEIWFTTPRGCDSTVILHLHVRDEVKYTYTYTDVQDSPNTGSITITDAPEEYMYYLKGPDGEGMGLPLTGLSGGIYELTVYDANGCPGRTEEILIAQECIDANIATDCLSACADEEEIVIPCHITAGIAMNYRIEYSQQALEAGFVNYADTFDVDEITIVIPDSCRPDHYQANVVIEDIVCGDTVIPIDFTIKYPSDIVRQKWNNVLAVTNERYNGGYHFSGFQWYRNGNMIVGATSSVYYLGDNEQFANSDIFHVVLTRSDDGKIVETCPITTVERTDLSEYPALTEVRANSSLMIMNVRTDVLVRLYNVSGIFWGEYFVDQSRPYITAPAVCGIYVIVVERSDERKCFKIVVR